MFGDDVSNEEVKLWHTVDTFDGTEPVVLKTVKFVNALDHVARSLLQISIRRKLGNPVHRVIYATTGRSVSFSSIERKVDENCLMLRAFVGDYIKKRRQGEKRSTVQNSADLLSLFFETPDVFTDDFIIDEIMDFFLAGAQTTGKAIATTIGHFATAPESLARVRSEFDATCKEKEDYAVEDYDKLS